MASVRIAQKPKKSNLISETRSAVVIPTRITNILATLVVLHCIVHPFVILMLPFLSNFFSKTVQIILLLLLIPVGSLGFFPFWKRHKNYNLLAAFILGLALIYSGEFLVPHANNAVSISAIFTGHASAPHYVKMGIMLSGAVLLAVANYYNCRHARQCDNPGHES